MNIFIMGKLAADADPYSAAAIIPHVNETGRENYVNYIYAAAHKAYAIAPGGTWIWRSDAATIDEARQITLAGCKKVTQQKCVLYAENDRLVFDAIKWPTLWGPYLNKKQSVVIKNGNRVGQRFYDIAFKTSHGNSRSLSEFKDKVIFVHFWGSWCSPCMRELPIILKLKQQLQKKLPAQVEMVLLQMREPFSQSLKWVKTNDLADLPLYDSGANSGESTTLTLKSGEIIADRKLAKAFPSSYVVDKHGIVLFSHYGPISDWDSYIPFFAHAVEHSGK